MTCVTLYSLQKTANACTECPIVYELTHSFGPQRALRGNFKLFLNLTKLDLYLDKANSTNNGVEHWLSYRQAMANALNLNATTFYQ